MFDCRSFIPFIIIGTRSPVRARGESRLAQFTFELEG
jgi:hypothetical protein